MGEYASFAIWRKLDKEENELYHQLYQIKQEGGSIENYLNSIGEDVMNFPIIDFKEINHQVYYNLYPMNILELEKNMQQCKYNLLPEWLLCFTFDEMRVLGKEMGVFQAETTIQQAVERIDSLDLEDNAKWQWKRYELYCWLRVNAKPDDRIHLSSDLIYYSQEGRYDVDYVKKDINEKIKSIKEEVSVPYWNKDK
ncbi:hypothetical protein CVD28_01775 [Bacillus sp. M6-12]|uniref:hypothetical protein n=1 Tax=Bacillus sp. M6-12 TaxID=2054166 RepID=UPI000C7810B2|nr:hypothetical protein [Bacillus sp. M6-12]PLS19161.1 hypothetical protein CVD28_01775 [Bacillus sp. M6-12]